MSKPTPGYHSRGLAFRQGSAHAEAKVARNCAGSMSRMTTLGK